MWWDTASPGTSKAPSSSLSRCSFSFQSVWFNFNAHIGSLSWICMDQLNPGRESYTIDKKMALLMHGAGPAYLTAERFIWKTKRVSVICANQNPQNQHFLFQFNVAQRFARAPSESFSLLNLEWNLVKAYSSRKSSWDAHKSLKI